jgi:mono/diheme cytochrome c family protein
VKALFQDPRVVSKANCSACHVHGDEGRYDEYTRLPRKYLQANFPLQ